MATGLSPADKLLGLEDVIHDERDRKLEEAREVRRLRRRRLPAAKPSGKSVSLAAKPSGTIDFRHLSGQVTMDRVLDEIGYLASMTGAGSRRDRVNPRVIKRKTSRRPKKRPEHCRQPPLTKTSAESKVMKT